MAKSSIRGKIAPRGLNPRQLAIRKQPHRGQAPKRWGPMDAHGAHGVVQMAAEDPGLGDDSKMAMATDLMMLKWC
jgi:hypothetical protein